MDDIWIDDPADRHLPLPFSAFRVAIECRRAGVSVGDLHDAVAPPFQPSLRVWMMGCPAVRHMTRWEIEDWSFRRAEKTVAERTAWTIANSSQSDLDIARWIA